jgi:hypothetical protein
MTTCRQRWLQAAAVATAIFLLTPATAPANVTLYIEDVTVIEGESGYLDLYFEVPQAELGRYHLAAYAVTLDLDGPWPLVPFDQGSLPEGARPAFGAGAVRFDQVLATAAPHAPVFPGRTPQTSALSDTVTVAHDDLDFGENLIGNNMGLMRIAFESAPGSAGVYGVTFDLSDPAFTNFADGQGDEFAPDYRDGTITVQPAPEPATLVLLLGLLAGLAARRLSPLSLRERVRVRAIT